MAGPAGVDGAIAFNRPPRPAAEPAAPAIDVPAGGREAGEPRRFPLLALAAPLPVAVAIASLLGEWRYLLFGLLSPVMIGLAGIAVLTFFLAFFSSLGFWVPADMWRPLVLIGVICSVTLLVLHPSIYAALPLALNAGLAWIAWTSAWTPAPA